MVAHGLVVGQFRHDGLCRAAWIGQHETQDFLFQSLKACLLRLPVPTLRGMPEHSAPTAITVLRDLPSRDVHGQRGLPVGVGELLPSRQR